MKGRLVLCDIDGTLVDTRGAGLESLRRAAVDVFGADGPPLNLCGATDGGIVRDFLEHFGEAFEAARVEEFYGAYLGHLDTHLKGGQFGGRVLPGVEDLLKGLQDRGAILGLLTGNIARGAALKMRHYALEQFFDFGAYGDDHHLRDELGPVALQRAQENAGNAFSGEGTIVLGDTPKDISCGKRIGAITVCVATGSFSAEDLRESGADLVFSSFSDVEACLDEMAALGGK